MTLNVVRESKYKHDARASESPYATVLYDNIVIPPTRYTHLLARRACIGQRDMPTSFLLLTPGEESANWAFFPLARGGRLVLFVAEFTS